mmetsp:Transcript_18896/g.21651  ORF Transcript_18896/g.21651 Transcript_18896/m.21651 type:complete len:238 (-) Transcript_18896:181-894(-)|eukprot:CAMPEP_0194145492 /NCGR_PEP_ID=MMETSP0152-20130528/17463_1 /TAXON_ID=1049557 /ORGANISM="Thalassiothrix antarctica, Strain L6-D1" /LENGTH=237 /DNA_ID=CAMNT_0038845741 /DNA_START=86 /DNA_END=799 /DNA_ORIENTATION=+
MCNTGRKKVLVLFASQTGNSQHAANQIAEQLPSHLPGYEAHTLSLDDFLEVENGAWSQFVLICLSSYGVGQAPMGGYSFREFCDYIVDHKCKESLIGLKFALLGLGDSMYTTFFDNPAITNEAMELAGASRITSIGKADASVNQLESIEEWIGNLWKPLKEIVEEAPALTEDQLKELQMNTLKICEDAISGFENPLSSTKKSKKMLVTFFIGMPIFVALGAVVIYLLIQSDSIASLT